MDTARRPLVVVDVETTGTDPSRDRIVEIGACLVRPDDFSILSTFHSLVHAGVKSTAYAQSIHGIDPSRLAGAPSEREALARFREFAGDAISLAGHNVCFDATFLRAAIARTGTELAIDYHLLDAWSVASFVLPRIDRAMDKYDLDAVCGLFGISRPVPHQALEDATATALVLARLVQILGEVPEGCA